MCEPKSDFLSKIPIYWLATLIQIFSLACLRFRDQRKMSIHAFWSATNLEHSYVAIQILINDENRWPIFRIQRSFFGICGCFQIALRPDNFPGGRSQSLRFSYSFPIVFNQQFVSNICLKNLTLTALPRASRGWNRNSEKVVLFEFGFRNKFVMKKIGTRPTSGMESACG